MISGLQVSLQNQQEKIRFSAIRMISWIKKILRALGWNHATLEVLITDNRRIQIFHRKYLKQDSPTDVMAFGPAPRFLQTNGNPFLGSLVISAETAFQTAPQFGLTWDKELLLYVCHGILHLMGERDDTPRRKARMEKTQQKVLTQILGRKWHSEKQKRLY